MRPGQYSHLPRMRVLEDNDIVVLPIERVDLLPHAAGFQSIQLTKRLEMLAIGAFSPFSPSLCSHQLADGNPILQS